MTKKEDKFQIDGSEEEIDGVHTRHPNRNEDKSKERSASDDRRKSVAIGKAIGPEEKRSVRVKGIQHSRTADES